MVKNNQPAASRRTILGAAALGVAGAAFSALPAHASETQGTKIRVATYNIHHAQGTDDVLDLERIASIVESFGADLVGLQEVDRHWSERSEWVDQPTWLARRLGMRVAYGANLDLDPLSEGEPRRQYGTAVLSRWPIKWWRNTYLPKFEGHEQRGLLETVVDVHGERVRFACTHLQHNDNLEREQQAAAILDLLGDRPRRTILVGDLNAVPEAPEIKTLTQELDDAWVEIGDGDGLTHPSEAPTHRIDYVLGTGDLKAVSAKVSSVDPAGSDHLPVVASYVLR
ncbi:endonuclease/exonuclease/phosphatase family protein [Flindersiella endophytica]